MKRVILVCIVFVSLGLVSGNPRMVQPDRETPFAPVSMDAADSLLATMDLDQKLDQFFVARSSNSETSGAQIVPFSSIAELGNDHGSIGMGLTGLDLINDPSAYQLLGLPKAPLLSSVKDPEAIFEFAYELGLVLRSKGVDFVIGPSLDIEFNDDSPYTAEHSFGNNPTIVTEKAKAYVDGMRSAGIMCVAGHFPGLGNTLRGRDPNPPMIFSKRSEFFERDLVPFKALINNGLQSVMMASAFAPGIDSSLNTTAASSQIAHKTLTDQLGFRGLTWCDLSQEEVSESLVQNMFLAGNDLLILPNGSASSKDALKALIKEGALTEEEVDQRCKRILQLKLWSARSARSKKGDSASKRMVRLEVKERQLYSDALVLLANDGSLPLQGLDTMKLAVIKISATPNPHLLDLVQRYAPAETFHFGYDGLEESLTKFNHQAERFNRIVLLVEPSEKDLTRKRFGLSEHAVSIIDRVSHLAPTTLIWNGNAKALRNLPTIVALSSIVLGHEVSPWSDDLSIQAVFGGREIKGELNRKIDERYAPNEPLTTEKIRLGYGLPEEVGIDRNDLKKIDSIAKKGIYEMAYPGCQIWFAKDGIVVVNEAVGSHTYKDGKPVKTTDLYDLASITKIAGSVAGLMKLSDEGSFNLDHNLCDYLSEWVDTTDYMQLNMREILAHQAGLTPWIPFYTKTITKGSPRYDVYSIAQSEAYPLRVAREFYIRGDYPDQMFRQILNHKLATDKKYRYSDIGYYFALRIIEKQSGKSLDAYLDSVYYRPLGLTTMGYKPLDRFEKDRITPTEFDRTFRRQLVHGDVHDPGAAMLGGVGGHAGLFSNANDLGIMMQMYLNGGSYGGQKFFDKAIIDDYTKCQFCENDNRRGAGFDKPLTDGSEGPSCGCTSLDAFGHQGFTGTVTWADPEEKVVYVFLSNRVYPDAGNKKLAELNIRTDIQKAFYSAIEKGKDLANEE